MDPGGRVGGDEEGKFGVGGVGEVLDKVGGVGEGFGGGEELEGVGCEVLLGFQLQSEANITCYMKGLMSLSRALFLKSNGL